MKKIFIREERCRRIFGSLLKSFLVNFCPTRGTKISNFPQILSRDIKKENPLSRFSNSILKCLCR